MRKCFHCCPQGRVYSVDELRLWGFQTKRPCKSTWSAEDEAKLRQAGADLASGVLAIHTLNPAYYIAHHVMRDKFTTAEVRSKVGSLSRDASL
jgi:hypothetical protein